MALVFSMYESVKREYKKLFVQESRLGQAEDLSSPALLFECGNSNLIFAANN